jgi:hypothetical protein
MGPRLGALEPRLVVPVAAVAAAALRFPGLLYPLGSDEAGFTLAAREWDPEPGSLYGTYWVDRPPTLIALIRWSDLVGGAYFIRVLAALGCVVTVLAAAATARAALRYAGETDNHYLARTGAWVAVLAAALTSSAMIDSIMAKGEILGIPFVMMSFWLGLRALGRGRVDGTALVLAAAAGLAAVLAQGMKQNLVSGLVFGAALLVTTRLHHRITTPDLLRLGGAALAGAAVPVLAVCGWAVRAGVGLDTLWYAVYGFRFDALDVLAQGGGHHLERAGLLLAIFCASGAAFVLAGVAHHRRRIRAFSPTLLTAAVLVIGVDVITLLLGGSFWRPYLFTLVPGIVLCAVLLLAVRVEVARRARYLVLLAAVVSIGATAAWTVADLSGLAPSPTTRTGVALRAAAEPGDTVVVYGGRAEIVLASGMHSPYQHLWSLPMRTLDPRLAELRRLLAGTRAPTWVVMWVSPGAWDGTGAVLEPLLKDRYRAHGRTCNGNPVYLVQGAHRAVPDPDCS